MSLDEMEPIEHWEGALITCSVKCSIHSKNPFIPAPSAFPLSLWHFVFPDNLLHWLHGLLMESAGTLNCELIRDRKIRMIQNNQLPLPGANMPLPSTEGNINKYFLKAFIILAAFKVSFTLNCVAQLQGTLRKGWKWISHPSSLFVFWWCAVDLDLPPSLHTGCGWDPWVSCSRTSVGGFSDLDETSGCQLTTQPLASGVFDFS